MTRYTAFRCPEDLLEKAKARAQKDRRSLSNYIIMLIEKDVSGGEAARKRPKAASKKSGGPSRK